MTNPLEQIRELADGLKIRAANLDGKQLSRKYMGKALGYRDCASEIIAILDASQGYACVPVDADDRHERELGKLIDERDRCEEIIDCLCDAVLGQGRPEWSSAYGYDDALLEVQEAMFAASPTPPKEN